jgi:hypothetical protein
MARVSKQNEFLWRSSSIERVPHFRGAWNCKKIKMFAWGRSNCRPPVYLEGSAPAAFFSVVEIPTDIVGQPSSLGLRVEKQGLSIDS